MIQHSIYHHILHLKNPEWDYRPTLLLLAGIHDSYVHDGRVVVENLDPSVLPAPIAQNVKAYETLVAAYKQLTAPYGTVATTSLSLSTKSVALTDDTAYENYVSSLNS